MVRIFISIKSTLGYPFGTWEGLHHYSNLRIGSIAFVIIVWHFAMSLAPPMSEQFLPPYFLPQ